VLHQLDHPAVWGFLGADLFAGENRPTGRRRALYIVRFCISLFFGTVGAAALSATVSRFVGWAELRAIAFVVGLGINKAWPKIERRWLKKILSDIAKD
jgi:divalent metal cation (Fe/Co/Zn/Cd) transporter